ncbi:MAG: hypothetical protein ACMV0I_03730 [Pseudomonas sp.]
MKQQATKNSELQRKENLREVVGCTIATAMFFVTILFYTRIIPMMLGGGQ